MRPRPSHHIARAIPTAIIHTRRQTIRHRRRERRRVGDGERLVAAHGPREAVVVVVGEAVVRGALVVVGGAEVLGVEGAGRGAVDVDAAVGAVRCGGGGGGGRGGVVTVKGPFGVAVAAVGGGGGRVGVGDGEAGGEEGAVFEAGFEGVGVGGVVGRGGFEVLVAADVVRVAEIVGVFGVVADVVGRLDAGGGRGVDCWLDAVGRGRGGVPVVGCGGTSCSDVAAVGCCCWGGTAIGSIRRCGVASPSGGRRDRA